MFGQKFNINLKMVLQRFSIKFPMRVDEIIHKISHERRDYESVDEKAYLRLCHEKRGKNDFMQAQTG